TSENENVNEVNVVAPIEDGFQRDPEQVHRRYIPVGESIIQLKDKIQAAIVSREDLPVDRRFYVSWARNLRKDLKEFHRARSSQGIDSQKDVTYNRSSSS
ncbi:hypothetical protein HAX54_043867, partial [Datura stramonium]|nr:hypothetical protein [Datura stramonium]